MNILLYKMSLPPKTQLGTAKTNSGQHSDSAKNSESGTSEHSENETTEVKNGQTQTNLDEFGRILDKNGHIPEILWRSRICP